jgi:hypothetical protein
MGSNVVAYLALFVALSGSAYAAATIGSAEIIDGSVQSIDIKNKNVKPADLRPAEPWHEVGTTGEPAFASEDPWGNTTYFTWGNAFPNAHETAGFYRDPYGAVHVKGTVCPGGSPCGFVIDPDEGIAEMPIFTLPNGYRPAKRQVLTAMAADRSVGYQTIRVNVSPDGIVEIQADYTPNWVALDSITFRCAPSGSYGCP